MNKEILKNQKQNLVILLISLFIVLPVIMIAVFNLEHKATSFPNIFLNSKNYGEINRKDAEEVFAKSIEETYQPGIKFKYQDQEFIISLSDLEMKIDETKTLDQIFSFGKKSDLLQSAKEQLQISTSQAHFTNEINESGGVINAEKWKEISKIENPAANFSYKYENGKFTPQDTHDGKIIDLADLKNKVRKNLAELKNEPVEIQLIDDLVVIENDKNGQALAKAEKMLQNQIVLEYDSSSWKIEKEDFGPMIGFKPKFEDSKYSLTLNINESEAKEYLTTLVPQINQEPVNAQLEMKDGKVDVFALSQTGVRVDIEKSIEEMNKEIFKEDNFAGEPKEIHVKLITENIEPEVTTDSIDNMGLTSLLATGESDFHGSTKSRVHNVTVGASKFNGVLIGPGDEFSFVEILGNVGPKEGYLPELVIKQGKTTPEYGGGLCQVSSTAFRGAVNAGLKITERKNHAYAVKYYAPQGTDATIYPPSPDLSFINDTPGYILIQTRISGTNLYFDFFGTSDNRKVELEGPVVYERGTGGAMKTWWKQKVYKEDGSLMHEDTFYSNYKSPELYPRTNPLE